MKKTCVIDYSINNIASICKALDKINQNYEVIDNGKDLKHFSNIILPGVGSFDKGINELKKRNFYTEIISLPDTKFILGICLGMQLLFTKSEESLDKNINGLNLIQGEVIKLKIDKENNIFVPHVGWNSIYKNSSEKNDFWMIENEDDTFYFANSYIVQPINSGIIKYFFDHGKSYPAIIQDKNIFATQFHPEKSQNGIKILKRFCEL